MNRLQRLPEITDHVLSGLKADDRAKHRILLAASGSQATGGMHQKTVRFRTVVTLCSLSVLLVLMCVLISYQSRAQQPADLQVIPAGSHRNTAPVNLQQVILEASELLPED